MGRAVNTRNKKRKRPTLERINRLGLQAGWEPVHFAGLRERLSKSLFSGADERGCRCCLWLAQGQPATGDVLRAHQENAAHAVEIKVKMTLGDALTNVYEGKVGASLKLPVYGRGSSAHWTLSRESASRSSH
jgi:hypothetical protein